MTMFLDSFIALAAAASGPKPIEVLRPGKIFRSPRYVARVVTAVLADPGPHLGQIYGDRSRLQDMKGSLNHGRLAAYHLQDVRLRMGRSSKAGCRTT